MRLLIVIISASLIQSGCSFDQSSQAVFNNYLYRLVNSLDVEIDHSTTQGHTHFHKILTPYPKKSVLLYDIPSVDINVLQFLQLSTCDLQRLIGQRNSSLGKLMTGYHALLYEYEFLILAQRCQATLGPDTPLFAELEKAIAHKQSYRNQLRWNETFAGDEIRYLFSLGTQALTPQQLSTKPIELVGALAALRSWLSNPTVKATELKQAYQVFETRKYIGELRLAMAMAVSALRQADELLEKRLSQQPLCYNQHANPKFKLVNQVFYRFYIGEVQPMLSQLHQQGQDLLGLIDQLQAAMATKPEFTEFWARVYISQDSEWQNFNQAIAEHTQFWQNLFTQCGQLPG